MKTKKLSGFVIELTLVFMLVTFGFCMVVTAFIGTLSTERKIAGKEIERQITLNQIGEYYLRSIEAGKKFPTLAQNENLAGFDWINGDTVATEFFNNCKGKYQCQSLYSVKRGNFLDFYEEKAVSHKLTITSGGTVQMVIIVIETRNGNDTANYEIKDWSITDIHEGVTYSEKEQLNVLQKLWIWLGNAIQDWSEYFNG